MAAAFSFAAVLALPARAAKPDASSAELAHWQQEAARVTITRDDWGIAHVSGPTDADAVFGMIYAQAEDDFNRVEANYLTSLGRTAEAEGESKIYQDLRQKLFIDPVELKQLYATSPAWLQKLMVAWADGLNFYLATHPDTHPRVIHHFEPWMALSFSEGSIGGDIERVNLKQLEAFYGSANHASLQIDSPTQTAALDQPLDAEPRGSNGIAISPSNTLDHHALLLINPHTSFFFRSELQMTSKEGLHAYGAVTWGQFFIYQGFNDHVGWMHTSSGVDAVDQYLETVSNTNTAHPTYLYGGVSHPMREKKITILYKTPTGMAQRTFTVFYTIHGPVIRSENGKWVTIQLMNIPVPALEQSYLRTKANSYAEYRKTMELQANSSNNTIFADSDGDIAYWHGNFIPRRDPHFDYTHPVDGSNPATNWNGLLTLDQTPHLFNPSSGYLFNVNDSPWNGAGASSLRKQDFPAYVEMGGETARGLHAIRVLNQNNQPRKDFTLNSLLAAAFDSYLPWFDRPFPALFKAYDALPASSPLKSKLAPQIAALRAWNHRWAADSIPTSLAVFWGEDIRRTLGPAAKSAGSGIEDYAATQATPQQLLTSLVAASDRLTADFGTWQTPWGHINRFQRINDDIDPSFNDAGPSIPVPFTSSVWGSLASFGARPYPNTKKWYGTSGNSFVAVVEFGPRIHARAITAGGESGHPNSPHFDDEATRYASGNLREVYFYPDQLKGHTERTYHPGGGAVPAN
jgi:acyl-homoserine lactone acylase PvdQ